VYKQVLVVKYSDTGPKAELRGTPSPHSGYVHEFLKRMTQFSIMQLFVQWQFTTTHYWQTFFTLLYVCVSVWTLEHMHNEVLLRCCYRVCLKCYYRNDMTKEYRVSIVYDREKQFENNVSVHDAMCDVVQCQTW